MQTSASPQTQRLAASQPLISRSSIHSRRNALTGFASAARTRCTPTVSNATSTAAKPEGSFETWAAGLVNDSRATQGGSIAVPVV